MNVKRLTYYLICIVLLSSCKQLKSLTSQDNSNKPVRSKTSRNKDVVFLDGISVTPGENVKSKHVTGPTQPKNSKSAPYSRNTTTPSGDIERADWLQLKYAVMLDATVEKLNNISMLKAIEEWWGTRYCMGGSSKSCIDCSAFTQVLMYNVYNLNIPRTAQEQYNASSKIGVEELNEGDLVFFNTGGRSISHVGVYLLNNKFVHAATSGGVMISDLNDSYWQTRFKGAGRMNSKGNAVP
jgi:cell wall-associated NlpC family hydrolase